MTQNLCDQRLDLNHAPTPGSILGCSLPWLSIPWYLPFSIYWNHQLPHFVHENSFVCLSSERTTPADNVLWLLVFYAFDFHRQLLKEREVNPAIEHSSPPLCFTITPYSHRYIDLSDNRSSTVRVISQHLLSWSAYSLWYTTFHREVRSSHICLSSDFHPFKFHLLAENVASL